MKSWRANQSGRLLTEVKRKFSGCYTTEQVRWAIEHNRCFVNNRMERFGSTLLQKGDLISIHIVEKTKFKIDPDRILFQDEAIILYEKSPFMTSEQIAHCLNGTLVHRLDRDTSGLFLLARSEAAQHALKEQFRQRTIQKEYLAIVEGVTQEKGSISGNMAAKKKREGGVVWGMSREGVWSQTEWLLIEKRGPHSLLLCRPFTGRTHQIRVHLSSIGHPIVGDPIYGSRNKHPGIFRPLLHASSLQFSHPLTQQPLSFISPSPSDFLFNTLKKQENLIDCSSCLDQAYT